MWPRIACVLIVGYLGLSRAFAYLGVPAWNIFVSEIVLAFLVFFGPQINYRPWIRVLGKQPALRHFLAWYGVFLLYGVIQVFHGISAGYPPLTALRDLAFNYYPVYFFLGLWAGLTRPDLLPRLIRGFAWFNGIYGILYILYLNRLDWYVPGVSAEVVAVPIFGQPMYSFVALLGLLVYEKSIGRSWYLWLLNGFVMLGMQFRTEWFSLAVGIAIWCVLTRQGKRVLQAGAIMASLLVSLYITDLRLPSPQGRAGEDISARQLIDRALAPFRADLADQKAAAGLGGVDPQEATFVFRTVWWLAIWDSVHSSSKTALLGHGYGFPLGELVPYIGEVFIRTPHNEFFFALGYTGWIGVVLFALFQIEIFRLLLSAYRVSGTPFGVVFWAAMTSLSMFFPLGETPYGAIPFYLILGWCVSPVLMAYESSGRRKTPCPSANGAGLNPSGVPVVAT
jgi:hypothetical protein